jgi:cell division protein ZapB
MISEFNSLSDKVGRLALLTQTLRQENADLRLHLTSMNNDKEALVQRMDQAYRRIEALLAKLPETALDADSDAEAELDDELNTAAEPAESADSEMTEEKVL